MSADKADTRGLRRLWRRLRFWLLGLLLWLSGAYLVSCTAIDLGGAVDNIGKQVPVCYPLSPEAPPPSACLNPDAPIAFKEMGGKRSLLVSVYHREGYHYVPLPVIYVPGDKRLVKHSCLLAGQSQCGQYPATYSPEENRQYPIEVFFAELNDTQYSRHGLPSKLILQEKALSPGSFRVLPASKLSLEGAECTYEDTYPLPWLCSRLPARTTSLHQCLTPLSWIAEVVDVPLSILATPVGWVYDLATFPMSREHR